MTERRFYTSEEIKPMYGEIVPVYQEAFQEDPWNSTTKCVDIQLPQRCKDNYSPLDIGDLCNICGNCPQRPAFEFEELIETFDRVGDSRPTVWYVERYAGKIALVMLAWKARPGVVALEKYSKEPEMKDWVENRLGSEDICWLDEVFADKRVRSSGNLANFNTACEEIVNILDVNRLAYRTIQPKMISAAERFQDRAEVFMGQERARLLQQEQEVPDWRDFVVVGFNGVEK